MENMGRLAQVLGSVPAAGTSPTYRNFEEGFSDSVACFGMGSWGKPIWRLEENGKFSLKSAYWHAGE